MEQTIFQGLGLLLGTGCLGALIRIAILAGRYMQRLEEVEKDIKEVKDTVNSLGNRFNQVVRAAQIPAEMMAKKISDAILSHAAWMGPMLLPFFGMYGLHPDVPHLRELPVLATSRPTPVVVTRSMLARKPRGVGVPTRGESIEPVKTAVFAFIQEGPRSTKSIYALPFPYTRISYAIRLLSESRAIEPTNAWDQGMFVRAYQVKAQAAAAS